MLHTIKIYRFILLLLATLSIAACDSAPQLKPLSKDGVILAFGDSLTHGTGADKQQAYPARLQQILARTVINAGIPGEVSKTGLARLEGLLKQYRPELLILCHGGNDILRRYDLKQTKENLQTMINMAKTHGSQVLMIGVPTFGVFLSSANFYKELATSNRLPLENTVLSDILADNRLKADQIHPNSKGYEIFAERIHRLLLESGGV